MDVGTIILNILLAVASVASLGIVFGILLSIAARFFAVHKDERIETLEKILPQVNCGACGFAGCASYAAALVGGETAITLCTPGGAEAAHKIADILELEKPVVGEKKITQVHCRGGRGKAVYTFEYSGARDCNALFMLGGGDKACKFGCLGMGSCIKVCPVDAIDYDDTGLVVVDRKKCIGCGKCMAVCPTHVMKFIPKKADYIVACNSNDSGPVTRKLCSVGCIACRICEKKSPDGGFVVTDCLSVIDYSKTGERKEAATHCPPECIIRN